MPPHPVAPVVTDLNRAWAMAQEPADWQARSGGLAWATHVAEQAERFERHYADDRKPRAEWQGLWRRVWWPRADPSMLHREVKSRVRHPYVTDRDPAWRTVLALLSEDERRIAERVGVMQFRPDDPRAANLDLPSPADPSMLHREDKSRVRHQPHREA